jgi:hypothetical protein
MSIMKTKEFIVRFLITFGVAFIANVLITICWNYFIKSKGLMIDWETSFRISLLLAIVIPLAQFKGK